MASNSAALQARPVIEVHVDAPALGPLTHVGWLYPPDMRSDLPATFEYSRAWLSSGQRFPLDPRLPLYPGEQHAPRARGFGIFMDAAPDRWGRVLMERREANLARKEKRPMRRLAELDFMLGVHDFTRSGALRFRRGPDQPFIDDSALPAPPVTDLRTLAAITKKLEQPDAETLPEYESWLAMLIAPGASLGGARPKAVFTQSDKTLWLAKFPAQEDRYDLGSWEYLTHQLAREAGIRVPPSTRLKLGAEHHTFCVQRFDRGFAANPQARHMYASAMTLLEREDGESDASYLDLVECLEIQGGSSLTEDLEQLFRRAVFNLLAGNRDDHLRNHGFIRLSTGWRLSDAFDMNPSRDKQHHVLSWDGRNNEPDLQALKATASFYRIARSERAQTIIDEIKKVVATWCDKARALKRPAIEVQMMAGVFAAE